MNNNRKKGSLIALLSSVAMVALVGGVSLQVLDTQKASAAVADRIAIVETEGKSGASIQYKRPTDPETKVEGIRFAYTMEKDVVDAALGEGDASASMLFIPTDILNAKQVDFTLENNTALEGCVVQSALVNEADWRVKDGNYQFIATLYEIPRTFYDMEITTVMRFEQGSTVKYSAEITRDMREVARAAYDDAAESAENKALIAEYLKYYASKTAEGKNFAITVDGVACGEGLYGDTVTATAEASEYGWLDENDKRLETIGSFLVNEENFVNGVRAYTTLKKSTGTIYYDGKSDANEGDKAYKLPVEVTNTAALNVVATDETAYVTNGEAVKANSTENVKTEKVAYAYEGEKCLGVFDLVEVTKFIETVKDAENLRKQGNKVTITGYYLLVNDIRYDPNGEKLDPIANSYVADFAYASEFIGVLDGNGFDLEYGINTFGLFGYALGKTASATVKDISLIVKSVTLTDKHASIFAFTMSATLSAPVTLSNVYIKVDVDCTITDIGLSMAAHNCCFLDLNNVIVDYSRVTLAENYTAGYVGTFGRVTTYYEDYYYKLRSNCYVVYNADYFLHGANGQAAEFKIVTTSNPNAPKVTKYKTYADIPAEGITANGVTLTPPAQE